MKQERKDQILKLIIEEFILTAEPVGSKKLLEKYKLECSPATIRNAMVELEEEGYIEKEHVSSGRIPSAKGYKYYLEHLDTTRSFSSIDIEFQREFQDILKNKSKSVEEVLSQSCDLLSEMTNMATVVLGPKASEERLASMQLIKLNENSAMGIFVTDSGYVDKKTFVIKKNSGVSFELLKNALDMLNDRLVGTRISELEEKAIALKPIANKLYGQEGDIVIAAFLETLVSFAKKHYQVHGQKKLLSLPEFKDDQDAFLSAVDTLEDPHRIDKNIASQDNLGYVNVGFTNEQKGDFAIISKTLNSKEQIAVVGPKRMDYRKILSALEYVAYMLDKYYFSSVTESNSLIPISNPVNVQESEKSSEKKKKKGDRR